MLEKFKLSLMFALSCLFGCASYQQVMVFPSTWEQVTCSSRGFGYRGEPMALATFESCVFNLKTLGYITLQEAEEKDAPKFDQEKISGKQVDRPSWMKGFFWEYSGNDKTVRYTVDTVATTDKDVVYQVATSEGRVHVLNGNLGLAAVQVDGTVERDYDPALKTFDWPLSVGKKWDSISRTGKGSAMTQLWTHLEVGGFGRLKVPAGEFEAYYILIRNDDGSRSEELWYGPTVRNCVKRIVYTKKGRTVEELTRYHVAQ